MSEHATVVAVIGIIAVTIVLGLYLPDILDAIVAVFGRKK